MRELSPAAKAALERYRSADSPPASVQARLHEQLQARLAQGAAPLRHVQASLQFVAASKHVPWYAGLPAKLSMLGVSAGMAAALALTHAPASFGARADPPASTSHRAEAHRPLVSSGALVVAEGPSEAPLIARQNRQERPGPQPALAPSARLGITARATRKRANPRAASPSGTQAHASREELTLPAVEAGGSAREPNEADGFARAPNEAGGSARAPSEAGRPAGERESSVLPQTTPIPTFSLRDAPVPNPLSTELALLQDAHLALEVRDFAAAHAALDEHARRFPRGELSKLRDVTRLLARCQAGRNAEVREAARAFLQANPDSPYTARVRKACE